MLSKVPFLSLITIFFAIGCTTNTKTSKLKIGGIFAFEALENRYVFELKLYDDELYAGTNEGLYKTANESKWIWLGPKNASVKAFVVLSEKKYLASANINNRDSLTIAKTTNSGQEWFAFRNGYGGKTNRIPTVMIVHPSNSNIIYAGGPEATEIAKSLDRGNSWKLIFRDWGALGFLKFIYIEKTNPKNIWTGGKKATLRAYLSMHNGKQWSYLKPSGAEAYVYDLMLKYNNANHILVAMDGSFESSRVVQKSTDGGKTWKTVLDKIGARTLTQSTCNPQTIYVSGRNQNDKLFFMASDNFGETWEMVVIKNGPTDIVINDMISIVQNEREALYFATNKGIYSYIFEK